MDSSLTLQLPAGASIHILTTSRCRGIVEAHRSVPGLDAEQSLVVSYLDGHDLDPAARGAVDAWEDLRSTTGQRTRYNSPTRFLNAVAAVVPDREQPFAVLIVRDGMACGVISGSFEPRALWRNAGRLNLLLPGLRCLSVPQTALITDRTGPAARLVGRYLKVLVGRRIVHRLELENLSLTDPLHAELTGPDGLSTRLVRLDKLRWCRQLLDPESGDPIEYHSKKTRSTWRRKLRLLAKEFDGELELVKVTSPDETDDFVVKAAGIVAQTYQLALGTGASNTPECKAFAREMAEEGVLRCYMFIGRGEPISYVMGDLEDGRFHLWATSFLPRYGRFSPGIVLLNEVMDDLVSSGAEVFDFGDGEAAYKEMLGSERHDEQNLRAYAPAVLSRTAFAFDVVVARLRSLARRRLARLGLLDRARQARRGLLRRNAG